MKHLTMKYVKEHRKEIDACINKHCPYTFGRLNDETRWHWIARTESEKGCHIGIECNQICKEVQNNGTKRIDMEVLDE